LKILVIVAICVASIVGFIWYLNEHEQQKRDAEVQAMEQQTEQFLRTRAHKYYS